MIKKCTSNIDPIKAREMLFGVTGIYFTFLVHGLVYEKITGTLYMNSDTNIEDPFRISCGLILFERTINYLLGLVYMHFTVPKEKLVALPHNKSALVGFLIWLSNVTQIESIYLVSFPLIIMTKSCSLISVIMVGVCCSRVRSKSLKLGPKKILIAIIATAGILAFKFFDPNSNFQDNQSTEIIGLVLLLISLLADGFVPDFQAEIKDQFKPTPIQMLVNINKWCAVFALLYLIVLWQVPEFVLFCAYHLQFVLDMLLMAVLSFVGQLFIYRILNTFKQHIAPFVTTTRKIMTVGLSIIYFKHQTSIGQILSILVVFGVTMFQFLSSIMKKQEEKIKENKDLVELVEEIATETQTQKEDVTNSQQK